MGTDMENLRHWENDNLNECSPEDWVWGFGIRSPEVLHGDCAKIEDEVLVKMLYEGILDKGAPAWTKCQPSNTVFGLCQTWFSVWSRGVSGRMLRSVILDASFNDG